MKVGIIGYRSWIGEVLADSLQDQTAHQIVCIDKQTWSSFETAGFQCLFIIPGKVIQTDEEMMAERLMVQQIANDRGQCKRQVLLSSLSIFDDTRYGRHKSEVEQAFYLGAATRRGWPNQTDMRSIAVRPGAIFGPTQDPNSHMLIPSIGREGRGLKLGTPDKPTKFISVYDLAEYLVRLCHEDPIVGDVPGTFTATPKQLLALWKTWDARVLERM